MQSSKNHHKNVLNLKIYNSIMKSEGRGKMFNLIKDEFEENSEDILETINKMLVNKKEEKDNQDKKEKQ